MLMSSAGHALRLLLYGSRWCAPVCTRPAGPSGEVSLQGGWSPLAEDSREWVPVLFAPAPIPNQRIAVSGQGSTKSCARIQGSGYDVTRSVLSALMPELIADDAQIIEDEHIREIPCRR